jgi:hypothetical protein
MPGPTGGGESPGVSPTIQSPSELLTSPAGGRETAHTHAPHEKEKKK